MFAGIDQYRLAANSPCIDAGTGRTAPSVDLDGNARLQGGAVDMGAYEYPGWPSFTRAYIHMPSHDFYPGDSCLAKAMLLNAQDHSMIDHPFFVILDLFGEFLFAPGFDEFDFFDRTFPPGLTEISVLPAFTWPEGVGSADGIVWYAALINPEMTELVGEMGVFDFGWNE